MQITLKITNADENLLKALKSVINLYPQARLKVKKENSLDNERYYTLETSPAIKKIDEWAKDNPELATEADKELEEEMKGYCENCHSV